MREGIIYDCPNANCKTPIYTGKCSKACIKKYNKEMGKNTMTNADRIRAMSDEELAEQLITVGELDEEIHFCKNLPECDDLLNTEDCVPLEKCRGCLLDWLKQPAEVQP